VKSYKRPDLEIHNFHGMLTVSPQMIDFFEIVRKISRTNSTVLIRGETGTGKELVATALHAMSPRKNGPFKALNCAVLNSDLLASELFGHVKGSFTGAIRDHKGLFEQADKGTVFLDEIAEIDFDIQARLLRVLQERTFTPVGGRSSVRVDTRVISATNKALRGEVAAGHFREDLMYRIRVIPIFLPRLADREGDVEALAWRFIEDFNKLGYRKVDEISKDARDALLSYAWPGNVRELHNIIEYAFAIGDGPVISLEEFTPELRGEEPDIGTTRETEMSISQMEKSRIVNALQKAKGKKAQAAEILDISRSTLWRKMREHGLAK